MQQTRSSAQKKRKVDDDSNDTPSSPSTDIRRSHFKRAIRAVEESPAARTNSKFQEDKRSLYQQFVESVNAAMKKEGEEYKAGRRTNEDMRAATGYALSVLQQGKDMYKSPPGLAVAMGSDDLQQLGIFTIQDKEDDNNIKNQHHPSLVVDLPKDIVRVAAGGAISLALSDSGHVYSWGDNDEGSLGRKSSSVQDDGDADGSNEAFPRRIDESKFLPEDKGRIVAIAVGDAHCLFLSINGNVYMSGMYKDVDSGKFREIEKGSDQDCYGKQEIPVRVHRLNKRVVSVSCGLSYNAALYEDGTMVTWGMGHHGQLARSRDMTSVSTDEDGNETYEIGKAFITEERVNEKGESYSAYLKDKVWEMFLNPKPPRWKTFSSERIVQSIACAGHHLMVSAKDGGGHPTLYTSGLNNYGQLGLGDTRNRHELTPVPSLLGMPIIKMAGGEHFSIVMDISGTQIFTFGRSDYGQLGRWDEQQGPGDYDPNPGIVSFPDTMMRKIGNDEVPVLFSHIYAGDRTAFAKTFYGDIFAWGFNETSALGVKSKNDRDLNIPHLLDVLHKYPTRKTALVRDVAPGSQHTLMVIERYG